MYRFLICISILISYVEAFSQDTLLLKPATVREVPWVSAEAGTKVMVLDSTILATSISHSLGQLLNRSTTVYFKNYGVSGLASINLRGTSPSHTALMWNGIKLQVPSLQQIDYSIVPVAFWDAVGVQYGPSISLNGADVAGGAIHLINQEPEQGFHLKYISQVGGFRYQQQAISMSHGDEKFSVKTQFNFLSAMNDFPFETPSGDQVRQKNAAVRQLNLMQHLNFHHKEFTWRNIVWVGKNERELPRTITGNETTLQDDYQKDNYKRIFSSLFGNHDEWEWEAAYAFQDNELIFNDSENYSKQHLIKGQGKSQIFKNASISAGIQTEVISLENDNYSETQKRTDYYIKSDIKKENIRAHLGWKQVWVNDFSPALVPSSGLAINYNINNYFPLKTSVKLARHFRYPTPNDLYWNPGGNLLLKPENGWSAEISQEIKYNKGFFHSSEITAFLLNVDDWILWKPNGNIWSPENVQNVVSKGIELQSQSVFSINGMPVEMIINYSFTSSTDMHTKKQLAYIPKHQANLNLILTKNNWFFNPAVLFTGERFTIDDNIEAYSLPPFLLLDFSTGYKFKVKKQAADFQLAFDNILNTEYQTRRNYAMPGRNFKIQLTITI